jgi:hypothetical protein
MTSSYLPRPSQMAQAYSIQPRNRRHSMSCANMRCMSSSCLRPRHPMAYLTVRLYQHATHFRSRTSRTRLTVTVSLYLLGGTVGEKSRYYATVLTQRRGGKRGSATSQLMPEQMKTERAIQVHESYTRHLCQTKVLKYAPLHIAFSALTRKLMLIGGAADPASTAQQPDARTSLSRKELRRERAPRRPRPAWHLPQPHRRVRTANRRTGRTTGLVVLLTADGRARTRGDGERRLGGDYTECGGGPKQARGCTDIADHRERAKPDGADTARGVAEFLQELAEHQRPRGESWHVSCESWRYSWEGGTNGSKDVGRWWWYKYQWTDGWG